MQTIVAWANDHDYAKLILIALGMFPGMLFAIATANEIYGCLLVVGMTLCGLAAYWLGNWKWVFIPVLAMLVEIACAVPLVIQDRTALETPISIVLEAPFWTGAPAFIGACAGYVFKKVIPSSRELDQTEGKD